MWNKNPQFLLFKEIQNVFFSKSLELNEEAVKLEKWGRLLTKDYYFFLWPFGGFILMFLEYAHFHKEQDFKQLGNSILDLQNEIQK